MKPILRSLCMCLASALCAVNIGAAERTSWTASRVVGSPEPPTDYHVQRVYPKLSFRNPVELSPLSDTGKMMLLELSGKLYTFDDEDDCTNADLVIDFGKELNVTRALGFGVHPNFMENRQIFVCTSTNPVAKPDGSRLSRFTVSDTDPPTIDPASEEVLLTWASGGHNGCAIRFDSKGLMYFSAGDGARPYPPDEYNVSQDLTDLRATICRIDVDRRDEGLAYAIPPDNPFVDHADARPEIWAYGFRNPWRFTIAPETDQLLCGDVGWELWELIHDVQKGSNHGWSIFEGPQPIRADVEQGPTQIRPPLVAYPHSVGQSVTGGIVYRGSSLPELDGTYLYGDYVTGILWGLRHEGDQVTWNPVLAETGLTIITFCESPDKEALVVSYDGGIYRLVRNPNAGAVSDFPRRLSQTGLFTSTESLELSPGVISYQLAAPSWDGDLKSEFAVGLPGSTPIRINQRQRNWKYPVGTVFSKTISSPSADKQPAQRLETQLLHYDGINWQPYTYRWNEQQTDAELLPAEGLVSDSGHQFANRSECRSCHSRQSGGAIGFTLENLGAPQVSRFVEMKILDREAPEKWNIRSMVNPGDQTADLESRARSYLMANCAHCHRRGGGGTVPLDLVYSNPNELINAIDFAPTQGTFGINDAKVVQPGVPSRSVLFYRMATSGTGHMPKLWKRENDVEGLKLVHDWIASLDATPEQPLAEDFGDTSASLRLLAQHLSSKRDVESVAVARRAAKHGNQLTAALFQRFLPPDERRKTLGENINAKEILAMEGDVTAGRKRFVNGFGQCIKCHRLQGSGQSIGPDLDGIARKRTRQQLLDSVLNPSKEIDVKFASHKVLTSAGDVVTGLKVRSTQDEVIVRSADGKNHIIPTDQIEISKPTTVSLMPTGLAAGMTASELADLVSFLSSLK